MPCEPLLIVIRVKNRGAVRGADIGALTIELSGIVRDGKKDAQQLAIGDLRRIVDDPDGFGMAGGFGDHHRGSRGGRSAGIADVVLSTPLTRSKTACVPQKQPPAKTAVSLPLAFKRGWYRWWAAGRGMRVAAFAMQPVSVAASAKGRREHG